MGHESVVPGHTSREASVWPCSPGGGGRPSRAGTGHPAPGLLDSLLGGASPSGSQQLPPMPPFGGRRQRDGKVERAASARSPLGPQLLCVPVGLVLVTQPRRSRGPAGTRGSTPKGRQEEDRGLHGVVAPPTPTESGWPGGPLRAAVQGPTPPPSSLPERSAADATGTGRTRVDRGVKERGARAPRGTTLPGARTGRPAPPARHGVRSTGPAWRTRGEQRGRTRGRAPGTVRRHAERPRPALQRGKWPGRGAVRTREAAGHGVRAAAGAVGGGS